MRRLVRRFPAFGARRASSIAGDDDAQKERVIEEVRRIQSKLRALRERNEFDFAKIENETPAETELRLRIGLKGNVSVAELMQIALQHPSHGYYSKADGIFDRDFTTAPEISQVFGELVGVFGYLKFLNEKSENVELLELGPGRGVLARDVCRAFDELPGELKISKVNFVETSQVLKTDQLVPNVDVEHFGEVDSVPAIGPPLLVIAQEFFDAMPTHQFVHNGTFWSEVLVDYEDSEFDFKLAKELTGNAAMLTKNVPGSLGETLEVSPKARSVAAQIAQLGKTRKIVGIFVDYSGVKDSPSSLRGIRRNEFVHPLSKIGETDLSVDVDFVDLADVLFRGGLRVDDVKTQAEFLLSLGLNQRVNMLIEHNPTRAKEIAKAASRLVEDMGSVYKVLTFESPLPI